MRGGPGPGSGMMGRRWGYGMTGGWGWIGWIVGIVIVLGIAAAVIVVIARKRRGAGGESPLDILKKRLARGEINKEEFDKLKHDVE